MPGDLVSGYYGMSNPIRALFSGLANVAQANVPPRSNAEYLGFGSWTDGALAATGVATAVPIPVDVGDVITKVSIIAGATAEATGTHSFAAIYSGIAVPALLRQTNDATGAAFVAASAVATWTLTTPYTIQPADCPNGFIYASVAITATTVPTAAGVSTPTAVDYAIGTGGPLFEALTHGSALGATAAATIASPAAKAVAPIVILT